MFDKLKQLFGVGEGEVTAVDIADNPNAALTALNEAQVENGKLATQNAELAADVERLKAENEGLNQKISGLNSENTELSDRNNELAAQNTAANTDYNALSERMGAMERAFSDLKAAFDQKSTDAETATAENQALKDKINAIKPPQATQTTKGGDTGFKPFTTKKQINNGKQ